MSLDVTKLERVCRRDNGDITARCPACAEGGGDAHDENHLVIFPGGKFGCVANPKDKAHRKRIFKLVGVKFERDEIQSTRPPPTPTIRPVIKPEFRGKSILASLKAISDASDALFQVTRACEERPTKEGGTVQGLENARPNRPNLLPYRTPGGTLVIPFDCPDRFHWWKPDSMRLCEIDRQFPMGSN
jgi:hypothetical protein